jgi:thioesterase domain-containing protein
VAVSYKVLADALGPDQPVWGLQSRGLDHPEDPHRSIVEMAAAYRAAIRTVQPGGPYHLVGWSLGGIVAQEMASQWESEGETVARIIMLDVNLPDWTALDIMGEMRFSTGVLANMADKDEAGRARRARLVVWAVAKRNLMPADTPPEWAENMMRELKAARTLAEGHHPSPCDADIVMFRAELETINAEEGFRWDGLCRGQIRRIPLPCRHNQILAPEMAARIAQEILA